MFIECPECATKFVVQADKIGKGRKVRCGVCKHEWFYESTLFDTIESHVPFMEHSENELAPIPSGSNVPAIIYQPAGLYNVLRLTLVIAGLALIILLFLLSVNRVTSLFPFTERLYNIFGISSTNDLSLQDISIESSYDTGFITIRGVMVNQSNRSRNFPGFAISLYGKDRHFITSTFVRTSELPRVIPANQEVAFEQVIKAPSERIEKVLLNIGNPLELALR